MKQIIAILLFSFAFTNSNFAQGPWATFSGGQLENTSEDKAQNETTKLDSNKKKKKEPNNLLESQVIEAAKKTKNKKREKNAKRNTLSEGQIGLINSGDALILIWDIKASQQTPETIEIEKTEDGVHFYTIYSIAVKESKNTVRYVYTNSKPGIGTNYFRLKNRLQDGSIQYSYTAGTYFSENQDLLRDEISTCRIVTL